MMTTEGERLILYMLAELHEKLEIDALPIALIKRAVETDNTWALPMELPGIFGDDRGPINDDVRLAFDLLGMWESMEESYEKLDEDSQTVVDDASLAFRAGHFTGIDGNHESQMLNILSFVVNDMGRFTRFRGRDLNSHRPLLDAYRGMIERLRPLYPGMNASELSVEEMLHVLGG